jgi:hypothetical protein
MVTVLVMLAVPTPGPAQEGAADQAAIYALVLRDVAQSVTLPVIRPARVPALVPYAVPPEQLGTWEPGPGVETIPDSVLRILRRDLNDLMLCRPAPDQACRDGVRGGVLRITSLPAPLADTVEVLAVLTQARAEHDNTVLIPRPLRYRYVLVRDRSGWRIGMAERARPDPRTA